jgi:hypothetical protein
MNSTLFFQNPIKIFQARKARKSLILKIEKVMKDFYFLYASKFSMEDLPRFFNTMDTFLKSVQPGEWKIAPDALKRVKKNTMRDPHGFFRANEGQSATMENTWLQPLGHWAEDFQPRTLSDLMENGNEPLESYGFRGTAKDLYASQGDSFMRDKMAALQKSLKELQANK